MKVHIVTEGEYSDYHIVGVFSTECRAKKFVGDDPDNESDIEEWEVNPKYPDEYNKGLDLWRLWMYRDGRSVDVRKLDRKLEVGESYLKLDNHYPNRKLMPVGESILYGYVWAKDEKHAVKITNEKRVQLIANGGWRE